MQSTGITTRRSERQTARWLRGEVDDEREMGVGQCDGTVVLRCDGDGADEARIHEGRWKRWGSCRRQPIPWLPLLHCPTVVLPLLPNRQRSFCLPCRHLKARLGLFDASSCWHWTYTASQRGGWHWQHWHQRWGRSLTLTWDVGGWSPDARRCLV